MTPIISVVGPSKADRTLLVEKLISELRRRGHKVATVKRDAHSYDLDTPGKASWRHSRAGAQTVIVSSPQRITMFKKVESEWKLDKLAEEYLSDADIVITDGFSAEESPKIKVLLSRTEDDNQTYGSEVFSIVSANEECENLQEGIPRFSLEEIKELADLVETRFLR